MRTKFENKLKKNQMIGDEIENKIQLKIINVNKTIINKRKGNKSKEKSKLKGWYEFLHGQHTILRRKIRKRKKEKKSNFGSNHVKPPYMCHLEKKRTLS
jgi:hypothetical protein